jgi:2-dehydro-3-deoxyphosphogluconate aldolase/(4S)-4-hydroxy-2-oxoglutarate aldolase
MHHRFSWELFDSIPVVGIIRGLPAQQVHMLAQHYQAAGLNTLEVTMNTAGAATTINGLVKEFGGRLNIGAGTVCNLDDLRTALDAGAQFIVTPVLEESVIDACVKEKIPVFPGAYTPTEIFRAWHRGAAMVKIFPATRLGPEFIKEVLAPLNYLKLIPTGGITVDNFTDFLKAGATGLGMGSQLFPKELVEQEKWSALSAHFSTLVERYKNYSK